jgi:hypothetical protein
LYRYAAVFIGKESFWAMIFYTAFFTTLISAVEPLYTSSRIQLTQWLETARFQPLNL